MSMLAERRRKTKWVINPTKKPLWATDSNGIKFGKELMEKMGWSAGKGLGAKEQGIQEPLKVSYKNDTKGMGFKGNDDDWIEQQDEFNVLLNQLRNSDDSSVVKVSEEDKNEIKSLEEKSRRSKARVHYQKFTRGKDLSRYSENDLACILGTNKIKKEKPKTEEVPQTEVKPDGHLETSFGVTTINSGSIQDYFKRKWVNDKAKRVPDADKEDSWEDERPSFSMGCQESLEVESKESSKKRKHKSDDETLDADENFDEKHEKSRKKKKKKDVRETGDEEEPKSKRKKTSEENSVDEELQGPVGDAPINEESKSVLLGDENGCDSKKKRKKEKKHSKLNEENEMNADDDLVEVKKKKKEKREKSVDTQEVASVSSGLEAESKEREEESIKKKNKKKGKEKVEVFDEFNKENIKETSLGVEEINVGVEGQDGVAAKAKKKKKKSKDADENGERDDEPKMEDENSGEGVDDCGTEVVYKKKKKKKEKREGNPKECCSQQDGIANDIPDSVELEQSKKKKRKKDKQREKESGSDDRESCLEETCQRKTNIETEKKKKKKDKKLRAKDESSADQQKEEGKESGDESVKPPEGESTKKKKKKDKKSLESESKKEDEEEGEVKTVQVAEGLSVKGVGNAEIGVAGVDRVEMISQRAAYEHIPGQHSYERVKSMMPWVNLDRFRGSNLEILDGYGFLGRRQTSAR